jgi:hypothetical protein
MLIRACKNLRTSKVKDGTLVSNIASYILTKYNYIQLQENKEAQENSRKWISRKRVINSITYSLISRVPSTCDRVVIYRSIRKSNKGVAQNRGRAFRYSCTPMKQTRYSRSSGSTIVHSNGAFFHQTIFY